jgi:hypothetical protein
MRGDRGRIFRARSSWHRWRRSYRVAAAVGLTAAVYLLLSLGDVLGVMPAAFSQPAVAQSNSHIAMQATASLTLVSPSSGQGPVGTHVTVQGAGWDAGATVSIGAAQSSNSCTTQPGGSTPLDSKTADGSGSFQDTFTWPSSLSSGQYFICAAESSGTPTLSTTWPSFTVLAAAPPTLSLSSGIVQAGQQITITGSNFFGLTNGQSVQVGRIVGGTFVTIATPAPGSNGTFVVNYTTDPNDSGNYTIQANSPSEGGAPPALSASASLVIQPAATATPSPTITATTSPTAATSPTTAASSAPPPSSSNGDSGGGLVVLLIAGIVVTLLALGGAMAFLLLRQRRGSGPAYPGGPGGPSLPGGPRTGGFGEPPYGPITGPVPGAFPSQAGWYGGGAPYGGSGAYGGGAGPLGVPDPYAGQPVGGVALWAETDPGPGPDWQPRPMSGARRDYDAPGYGGPLSRPTPGPNEPTNPAGFGPPDPWAQGAPAAFPPYAGREPTPPSQPWQAPPERGPLPPEGEPDGDSPANGQGGAPGPWNTNPANDNW